MGPALVQVVRQLPSQPGVYRFGDGDGEVLYVGRAAQLRSRVASYWSDLGDRRHLQPMVAAVASIEALVCGSRHEAAWLERNVLEGAALPPWNRTPGGQETPAVIVLDRRRPRPRLVVAHLPHEPIAGGRVFGPFLGGLQVRRAVAGLHRLYPLAYTGTRISGTERAMAVERSVTEGDRDTLADALTAVLGRDPAAVAQAKAHLEALRQRAVSAEAFELAARIDGELSGLEWISSVQRVTTLSGEDADVFAWSRGLLVHFAVRSGRLQEWTSRRSDLADATSHLRVSPASWIDFAQRNADLAAALVSAAETTTRGE